MKNKETFLGVLVALGISVTAAIALPLVNVFRSVEPSELMVVRGGVTAVLCGVVFTKRVSMPSMRMLVFSLLFSFATLALYAGIRAWGASPTLVVGTMTPVVNITAKLLRGQSVDGRVYVCLAGLLLGVMITLNPWQGTFDPLGFTWSVVGTLFAGLSFEVLTGRKGVDSYNKTFWVAIVTAVVGFGVTFSHGHLPFTEEVWNPLRLLGLLLFGAVGGFAYYLATIVAFEKLKTEVASTLAMAETPAVIVGAYFLLGETLTFTQWGGVLLAFVAVAGLGIIEARSQSS